MARGAARPAGRRRRAASSPARRARTRPASPPRGSTCSRAAGWDVASDGLQGAPRIRVLAGGERHVTIDRSLRLLGLGTRQARARPGGRAGPDARRRAARGARPTRRPDDRLRPGRQRQHGRVRPARRDRRRVRGRRRLAARRRRLRALGRRQPSLPPSRRRLRARRLLGDRRAQVAERPLRLRPRLLPASGAHGAGDGRRRQLPPARRRPQPVATGCRSRPAAPAASRSGRRCARSDAAASPTLVERCCEHARTLRRAARRPAGGRDPERRRPQPGARPLRRRRRDDARGRPPRPGGRHLLARRHRLARPRRDADLGLQLPHDPRRTSSAAPRRS